MILKKLLLILITGIARLTVPAVSVEVHPSVIWELNKQTTVYITKTGSSSTSPIEVTCGRARSKQPKKKL